MAPITAATFTEKVGATTNPSNERVNRSRFTLLAILSLLIASCGGSAGGRSEQQQDNPTAVVSGPTDTTEPGDSEATDSDPPDLTGLRVVSYPALGGTRLGTEDDVVFVTEGDYMSLSEPGSDARVILARVSQTGDGKQVVTIDDFLAEVDSYANPSVTVSDETISIFGTELTLHEFRDAAPPPGPGLFAARPFEYFGNVWWTPAPLADVFLGEIEGGVIAFGTVGSTNEGLSDARELLDDVATTLSLTTANGQPSALPTPDDRFGVIAEPLDFSPATLDPDGAPEFTQMISPVEPSEYQIGNLSVPISFTAGPGWFVAVNVPTFLVFTELPPVGPGFRDIIFQQGVNAIAGVDAGPSRNTDIVAITNIEDFLADPPGQLIITDVDMSASIGGKTAVRFDLVINPSASCQADDPCQFLLTSGAPNVVKSINPGVVHRFWWIDDVPAGPLVISTSTAEADADWLDTRAAEFFEGIEFAKPAPIEGLPEGMPSEYTGPELAPGTYDAPYEAISGGKAVNVSGDLISEDGAVADVRLRILDLRVEGGSVECAGQQYDGPFTTDTDQLATGNRISIAGWGTANVVITQTSSVFAAAGGKPLCNELTGTWAGTGGQLEGRTGTFRLVNVDSVETVTLG